MIAQKKDSVLLLYKENIELKKQLTDVEKAVFKLETEHKIEYKALERFYNHWLNAIGLVSTLIILSVGLSILRNYNIAKTAGEQASKDIKTELKIELDPIREQIKLSQIELENLKTLTEEAQAKYVAIITSLSGVSELPNQSPDNI